MRVKNPSPTSQASELNNSNYQLQKKTRSNATNQVYESLPPDQSQQSPHNAQPSHDRVLSMEQSNRYMDQSTKLNASKISRSDFNNSSKLKSEQNSFLRVYHQPDVKTYF